VNIELRRAPTDEEIESICSAAEEAARKFVLSKISLKKLEDLDLTVEAVGDKPLSVTVEVALETDFDDSELDTIIDKATDAAFAAAETKIRELDLCDVSSN
jgi:arsenate reductase-like glutaredoxin family protein